MIKLKSILNEEYQGKTIVQVDIQPEYEKSFSFDINEWVRFTNNAYQNCYKMIFLYNGSDTVGDMDIEKYKYWLMEQGIDEEVIDGSIFYDKGYAFFRYCMDSGASEQSIVNFVRFMYENSINDSRDMDRREWAKYLRQYRHSDKKEIYELLKNSDDLMNIPDLMEFIKIYSNIYLTGGGIEECLKEVEIALKALNKNYSTITEFTY